MTVACLVGDDDHILPMVENHDVVQYGTLLFVTCSDENVLLIIPR